jgi:hypothetical protein
MLVGEQLAGGRSGANANVPTIAEASSRIRTWSYAAEPDGEE